ncbi:MAG: hypothetical protein ACPLZY_02940 [Candidatus Norongarragalinales archaeon]
MDLTLHEIWLALALASMGFALTSRSWLLFLDGLNPFQGLIIYYLILYVSLYMLSRLDLVVFGFKIKDPTQTLGLLLITFAFFICVDWESPFVQIVTGRSVENVSPVLFQAEDGAVWFLWEKALPWANLETLRLLTYVATPFALASIGGLLVSEKVKFSW